MTGASSLARVACRVLRLAPPSRAAKKRTPWSFPGSQAAGCFEQRASQAREQATDGKHGSLQLGSASHRPGPFPNTPQITVAGIGMADALMSDSGAFDNYLEQPQCIWAKQSIWVTFVSVDYSYCCFHNVSANK